MSSIVSMPTEMRIMSLPMPIASRSWYGTCWCVVEAGWITRVFASPTFARCEARFTFWMKRTPAS